MESRVQVFVSEKKEGKVGTIHNHIYICRRQLSYQQFYNFISMRVMKAFEIEASYQKHRQRLTSIQGFNCKKKAMSSTSKTMEKINNYKKSKITAEIFNEKEKMDELSKGNIYIQKSLTKVYNRDPYINQNVTNHHDPEKSLKRISSRSSVRSANSESSRIKIENKKMEKKLADMKSTYTRFRQTANSQSRKNSMSNNEKNREQIVRLLEMQLGMKPKVLFPHVRKRKPENTTLNGGESLTTRKQQTSKAQIHKTNTSNSFANLNKSGSSKSKESLVVQPLRKK